MATRDITRSLLIIGILALSACSGHGTGEAGYSVTNDTGLGASGATAGSGAGAAGSAIPEKPAARGATSSGAADSTRASTPAPSGPGEKEEQRGNTPPGVSRDGAGPLGGAIVDPTGAVTKGR